tara:strand:+ start:362 stop:673 length:312 start_codon:yes stop_codon:yes gene_type:complete
MNNLIHLNSLNANILQTLGPLPIYLLIFIIIYFIMIRPQVKQKKEHSAMLENLKKSDRVITRGGIIGIIKNIKGKNQDILELDVSNTRVDVLKSHITSLYNNK